MAFIDEVRDRFGVEPICRVLTEHGVKIAPSGYYAFRKRAPSARALRDGELKPLIEQVFFDRAKGRGLAGARKMWHLLAREGVTVARCTVERLMRELGLQGARRGRPVRTTRPDEQANRPPDHVQRCFTAARPNQLWVVDFTYVPTWEGFGFTAFVTDVFSRQIVGWRTASRMPTELPLDALEMALWVRGRAAQDVTGVTHHSDAGRQTGLNRSSQHLDRGGLHGAATGVAGHADGAACDEVAWASADPKGSRAGVLGQDRCRDDQRGRRRGCRRVGTGRIAVVP